MTPQQVLAFAAWPRCPVRLPDSIDMAGHGVIVNVPAFIGTQLARLDSDSERLRALAAPKVEWIARKIEQFNSNTSTT